MATRVGAVIQARTGSRRLPNKVMAPLGPEGRPMLAHVVERVQAMHGLNAVVLAVPVGDTPLLQWARANRVEVYEGHPTDVLSRYVEAAERHRLDLVVRVTADCPLWDPAIGTQMLLMALSTSAPYCSNTEVRSYPDGLDTEIITRSTLIALHQRVITPEEREHVTLAVRQLVPKERRLVMQYLVNWSAIRWTVDEPGDLVLVRALLRRLPKGEYGWRKTLDVMASLPKDDQQGGIRSPSASASGFGT